MCRKVGASGLAKSARRALCSLYSVNAANKARQLDCCYPPHLQVCAGEVMLTGTLTDQGLH